MREEADEKGVIKIRGGRPNPPFIYVHDIRDLFKRVKRNAWRKNNAEERQRYVVDSQVVQRAVERARKEIEVLEDTQHGEVPHKRQREPFLAIGAWVLGGDPPRHKEVHRGAGDHQRQKTPIPPAIEYVTGHQKEDVLRAMIQSPVDDDNEDQEGEIRWRIKKHGDQSKLG